MQVIELEEITESLTLFNGMFIDADYFAVQGVKLVALYVGVILLAEKHGLTVAHAVFGVCNPGLIAF